MAINLNKLILCPSDDSKIIVVETWKNMPIAVASSQVNEKLECVITQSPINNPTGAVSPKIRRYIHDFCLDKPDASKIVFNAMATGILCTKTPQYKPYVL